MCRHELECMQRLLIDLKNLTGTNLGTHSLALGQRIKFLFRKAKLQYHKSSIDSIKSSLTLVLSGLQYARAVNEGAPNRVLYGYCNWVLRHLLTTCRESLSEETSGQYAGARHAVSTLTESLREDEELGQIMTPAVESTDGVANDDNLAVTTYADQEDMSNSASLAVPNRNGYVPLEAFCELERPFLLFLKPIQRSG